MQPLAHAWEMPSAERPVEPPVAPGPPPGMLEIVSRGIDLNVRLTSEVRQASLYAGLLFLAAIGPIAAIVIVQSIRMGGFDWLIDTFVYPTGFGAADLGPLAGVAFTLGALCVVAISVDVQLIATALLGGRVAGHTLTLRETIGWARQGFWRLILASITVGLILIIPRQVLAAVLRGSSETRLLLATIVDLLLSAPFAYVGAAVILARSTPLVAVRQSWTMAHRRWRLAFVIGIVNTAVSYLATFAIGVGLDILTRIATALGIDQGLGPVQSIELAAIVGFAIMALGSLTLTIAALTVAPQVIAWVGLGGPSYGVVDPDPDNPFAPAIRPRLVSRPMQVALVVSAAAAAVTIITGS